MVDHVERKSQPPISTTVEIYANPKILRTFLSLRVNYISYFIMCLFFLLNQPHRARGTSGFELRRASWGQSTSFADWFLGVACYLIAKAESAS